MGFGPLPVVAQVALLAAALSAKPLCRDTAASAAWQDCRETGFYKNKKQNSVVLSKKHKQKTTGFYRGNFYGRTAEFRLVAWLSRELRPSRILSGRPSRTT